MELEPKTWGIALCESMLYLAGDADAARDWLQIAIDIVRERHKNCEITKYDEPAQSPDALALEWIGRDSN